MAQVKRVLFVCLGNICRSPLAEGIFLSLLERREVEHLFAVDSCGTGGWHAGQLPDPRARAVARKNGIELTRRARQIDPSRDIERFETVVVMDRENHANVVRLGFDASCVRLMRSFDKALPANDPHDAQVPDPYYGGEDGFDEVYSMLVRACEGLLDELTGCAS